MTFLWGAATAAHQIEGNNTNSDWWTREHESDGRVREPSGDACDSYHRWGEDMDLLAAAGLTDYRFSVEWARIEPAPGEFSDAQLGHYRAMIEGAVARGIRPMITLHHFTVPQWFAERGGWAADDAAHRFSRYVDAVAPILDGHVLHVCTINEPNIVMQFTPGPTKEAVVKGLLAAHKEATKRLTAKSGWSVACLDFAIEPGDEEVCAEFTWQHETQFLEAAADDDWIGVQAYTRTRIGVVDGRATRLPVPDGVERTLTGWEYYPAALGDAVRHVSAVTGGMPIIVTENGIATDEDTRRIEYTAAALDGLHDAMRDGADVQGYFHWSLLDNYEWGRYSPTFGLIAVDRNTFTRTPKPSLQWLATMKGRFDAA
jgi:beta-glucosidase